MGKKPRMLLILDGWGLSEETKGNAIAQANTPNFDRIWNNYPHTELNASGLEVGLPKGQMGNSEVGHLNIGAGRIIYQEFTRINKEIEEGGLFKNEALLGAIQNAKQNNTNLHLLGLLSDGGVHSHIEHVEAILKLCKNNNFDRVYVHGFLDGRDVPPQSALDFIDRLEKYMAETGVGKFATISGRYYAMDRDKRWERVALAYNAMVKGEGEAAKSAREAVENSYKENRVDEFVLPTIISADSNPVATIKQNDSVIFFNFRPDRAREITRALVDSEFSGFERKLFPLYYATLTNYDTTITGVHVAYEPENYNNTFGEYISKKGLKQLRIAETEKYAHVTFFFNGGTEAPNEGEERALIPSPKVPTYDLQPEMSAYGVASKVIEEIESDKHDFIVLNFANPDMVGHTGVMEAAIKAINTIDECLGKVVNKVLEKDGAVYITADHGNAEQMIDYETGEPYTAHTTNKVPFIVVNEGDIKLKDSGRLCDIIPTIFDLAQIDIPTEMTGKSLLIRS